MEYERARESVCDAAAINGLGLLHLLGGGNKTSLDLAKAEQYEAELAGETPEPTPGKGAE